MTNFASTGDLEGRLTRKRNRFLSLVRRNPGISRQHCARLMSLSTFNISRLVPELIEKGMIMEDRPASARNGKGRPSTPLRINPEYEYFAGVDIEASQWRFAISDFAGNPVVTVEEPFGRCAKREDYINLLHDLLQKQMQEHADKWEKVAGIGIGCPGGIDFENGIIVDYELLPGFSMIPIRDICSLLTGRHTVITDNIRNLAVYDYWKNPESEKRVILHVAVRSGIASVLSIYGNIYRGARLSAGELGLFCLPESDTFLQEIAGLAALKNEISDAPSAFWRGDPEAVEREYRKKHSKALLDRALENIGGILSNLAIFIDPDEVRLYSTLINEKNFLWEKLLECFDKYQDRQQRFARTPLCCATGLSHFNVTLGAALRCMETLYVVR